MTRQPDAADDAGDDPPASDDPRRDHPDAAPSLELRATVVRYDARPDRCTIHPRTATGVERMATWLSADASAFVALDDAR